MTTNTDPNLAILDALADAAAQREELEGRPTAESRAAARRYQTLVRDKLAEMRREELARHSAPIVQRPTIPAWLREMARPALEALLAALRVENPALGFAHQKLSEITDDDLRTMIQDAQGTDAS
ncbi:MAG: hypothetical protein QM831_43990 [Kofleriaceae bacterium]